MAKKDATEAELSDERKQNVAQIFKKEFDTVETYRRVLERVDITFEELQNEYKSLGKKYESLLRQSTKLLRTGDAAQRKLMNVQQELEWRQNLNALWIAQFLSMVGSNACLPFLPLYVRQLGITDPTEAQFWSGLVFAGPFFLSIITVPLWGTLGDKHGKKPMILRAVIGLTVTLFAMAFAPNVYWLFALRLIQGAVAGFVAASLGLVASITPEKSSGYAMGFLQSSVAAGTVVGPLIGGLVVDAIGIRTLFYVVAALGFIATIVVVALVREPDTIESSEDKDFGAFDNIRYAANSSVLRWLLVFIVVVQTASMLTTPIMAYFLESLHTPSTALATITGIMVGLVGILTTASTLLWGRWNNKRPYEFTMLLALPILAIATAVQAFMPSYPYLFPWRIIIGAFMGALLPTLNAALAKASPPERRGGMMGLASSAQLMGNLISPLLCSFIAVHFGMMWCFVISGLLFVSITPSLFASYKRHHAHGTASR
jgi:DHA1 family multidrug resistance protein-like MFS transporter